MFDRHHNWRMASGEEKMNTEKKQMITSEFCLTDIGEEI